MSKITPSIYIDERELQFEYIRASGPGGQNVNKVATAVQLRFDIANSPSLASDIKGRLVQLAGKRVNTDGVLVIEARRFRTQEANREDAIRKFVRLVQKSMMEPKKRVKTKPTYASHEKRLKEKRQRGGIKRIRQNRSYE
ncbi:MAG TPA: alternative ribosome rescue aminoacyl-tRNA hydrolase ArfB [Anaerolineales bacterium]|nr:alternative ribosome rescue aminoacyl-tRNA hydrolase ArfB [Anaerolineales bacterium]